MLCPGPRADPRGPVCGPRPPWTCRGQARRRRELPEVAWGPRQAEWIVWGDPRGSGGSAPSTACSGRWAGGQPCPVPSDGPTPETRRLRLPGRPWLVASCTRAGCVRSVRSQCDLRKQPRAVLWAGRRSKAEASSLRTAAFSHSPGPRSTGPAREKSALGAPCHHGLQRTPPASSLAAACPTVTIPTSSGHGHLACDVSTGPRGWTAGRSVANALPVRGRAVVLRALCVVTDGC